MFEVIEHPCKHHVGVPHISCGPCKHSWQVVNKVTNVTCGSFTTRENAEKLKEYLLLITESSRAIQERDDRILYLENLLRTNGVEYEPG